MLSTELRKELETRLGGISGTTVSIVAVDPVSGGDTARSWLLTSSAGEKYFLKTHDNPPATDFFRVEFNALQRLAEPEAIRVPQALAWSEHWLVIEALVLGPPGADWQERMGRSLALLHQRTQSSRFGNDCHNFIGSNVQKNTWHEDWVEFWRTQRLQPQLMMAADILDANDTLLLLGGQLLDRLDTLIGDIEEPAVLLHGDLWSGNAAADESGGPVIFDPASYYGQREAEFGMMRLFGGFGPRCEAAYNEVWPLAPEHDRRIAVYRLYHELNHFNLFGGNYHAACVATLRGLL